MAYMTSDSGSFWPWLLAVLALAGMIAAIFAVTA